MQQALFGGRAHHRRGDLLEQGVGSAELSGRGRHPHAEQPRVVGLVAHPQLVEPARGRQRLVDRPVRRGGRGVDRAGAHRGQVGQRTGRRRPQVLALLEHPLRGTREPDGLGVVAAGQGGDRGEPVHLGQLPRQVRLLEVVAEQPQRPQRTRVQPGRDLRLLLVQPDPVRVAPLGLPEHRRRGGVVAQRPRQVPGRAGQDAQVVREVPDVLRGGPVVARVVEDGLQVQALGGEPRPVRPDPTGRRGRRAPVALPATGHQLHRVRAQPPVVPEQPGERLRRLGPGEVLGRQIACVGGEQVVGAQPPVRDLLDEVHPHQVVDRPPHVGGGQVGQRGDRGHVVLAAGVQPEVAEHQAAPLVEGLERPGEHRADAVLVVGHAQQPVLVGQLLGEVGQRRPLPHRRDLRGDAEREGQVRAAAHQRSGRARLLVHLRPDRRPQQPQRVLERQQVQVHAVRPVAHAQGGHAVPAGDEHEARGAAGQQGQHLVDPAGVVQHHEQPPLGEQRAVAGGPFTAVAGDVRDAEGAQETGQHVVG